MRVSYNSLERIGCTDECNKTYKSDSSLTKHRKEKHRYVPKRRCKPNGGTRLKNDCLQRVNTSRGDQISRPIPALDASSVGTSFALPSQPPPIQPACTNGFTNLPFPMLGPLQGTQNFMHPMLADNAAFHFPINSYFFYTPDFTGAIPPFGPHAPMNTIHYAVAGDGLQT